MALISKVVVAISLVCVLAIFLAPQFDLPESGLRAKHAAESLLWGLAAAALFVARGWPALAPTWAPGSRPEPSLAMPLPPLASLNCTLLC